MQVDVVDVPSDMDTAEVLRSVQEKLTEQDFVFISGYHISDVSLIDLLVFHREWVSNEAQNESPLNTLFVSLTLGDT